MHNPVVKWEDRRSQFSASITTRISGLMVHPIPVLPGISFFPCGKALLHMRVEAYLFSPTVTLTARPFGMDQARRQDPLSRLHATCEETLPEVNTSLRGSQSNMEYSHACLEKYYRAPVCVDILTSPVFFTTQWSQMWLLSHRPAQHFQSNPSWKSSTVLALRITGSLFKAAGCLYGLCQLAPWLQATGLF